MIVRARRTSPVYGEIGLPLPDSAAPEDPNEISFSENEIVDLVKQQGSWCQVRKVDGSFGGEWGHCFGDCD
jgi:hypothetical protein